MRDGTVGALVEVLDDDFPIRSNFVNVAPKHPHMREINSRALEDNRQFADHVAQRSGGRRWIDENQRSPRLDRERHERECVLRELALLILTRRGAQRAVEVVSPSVIVALQRLAIAGAFENNLAPAMPAHVGKRANRFFSIPHNHDRDVTQKRREKIPDVGHLPSMSHVLPRAMKDPVLLSLKTLGLDIPSSRQRIASLKRTRYCGVSKIVRSHTFLRR